MKLSQVKELLDGNVLAGKEFLEQEVESAFGSDLMSDVLAFVDKKVLLLTGLVNPQVIRTAEMMDITAIVFVRGKCPDESVIDLAKAKDMVIITTDDTMYVASGKLYSNGLTGGVKED